MEGQIVRECEQDVQAGLCDLRSSFHYAIVHMGI
jgi:hypothetical protein